MKTIINISTPAYYYEEPDFKSGNDIILSNFKLV